MSEHTEQPDSNSENRHLTMSVGISDKCLKGGPTTQQNSERSTPQNASGYISSVQNLAMASESHPVPASTSEDAPRAAEAFKEDSSRNDQNQAHGIPQDVGGSLQHGEIPAQRVDPRDHKIPNSGKGAEQGEITFTVTLPPHATQGTKIGNTPVGTRLSLDDFRSLLGIPEWKPLNRGPPGGRNYNYEELYDEDKPGEETGPFARFFKVFNDEAELFDNGMVRNHTRTLDALLVLAALFSAIVTAFIIEAAKTLEPDHASITNDLIDLQIRLSLANGNTTEIASLSKEHSSYDREAKPYSSSDVWINGLLLTSLVLSLLTALLSVLAKQWLQAYDSQISGNPREQALIRQLRFRGVQKWKMEEIIGALPLILHASLVIFLAGLFLLFREMYLALSWIIVGLAGPTIIFYIASIVIPAMDTACPYRIPLLYVPMRLLVLLYKGTYRPLYRWLYLRPYRWLSQNVFQCIPLWYWNGQQYQFCTYINRARAREDPFKLRIGNGPIYSKITDIWGRCVLKITYIWRYFTSKTTELTSLAVAELTTVQANETSVTLVRDCILWLHSMSSNSIVRSISAQAVAGQHCQETINVKFQSWSSSFTDAVFAAEGLHKTAIEGLFHGSDIESHDTEEGQERSHAARALVQMRDSIGSEGYRPVLDLLKDTLAEAVKQGRMNHVKFILRMHKYQDNPPDQKIIDQGLLLHLASENGHHGIVRVLLENGADVNYVDGPLGTALQAASGEGHLPVVELLLEKGADVNKMDAFNGTPLHSASYGGHLPVVQLLLEKGADMNTMNDFYGAPLHAAPYGGHLQVVELLLEKGADVNAPGSSGKTALQTASKLGHLPMVKRLLENGADVNGQGGVYETPLYAASAGGHLPVVEHLVEKGADVNVQIGIFGTALQAATLSGRLDVVAFLKEHGAIA